MKLPIRVARAVALTVAFGAAACASEPEIGGPGNPEAPALLLPVLDTVHSLVLSLLLADYGGSYQLIIDPDTRSQMVTSAPTDGSGISPHYVSSNGRLRIESADALPNGRHVVLLRAVDGSRILRKTVVVDVADVPYAVTQLGDPGLGVATPSGMNSTGDIVGWAKSAAGFHAIAWKGTAATVLPTPAGFTDAWATELNDRGDIVGAAGGVRVVRWTNGVPQLIDDPTRATIPAVVSLYIAGIDSAGSVAFGYYSAPLGTARDGAFVHANGTITDLTFIPRRMNERGQVVGLQSTNNGLEPRAAAYGTTWRATEHHWTSGGGFETLLGVNDAGWIIGYAQSGFTEPFLSIPGLDPIDLGPLTAHRSNMVTINNAGTIVTSDGILVRDGRSYRVALDAAWELISIADMNDSGQLAAVVRQKASGQTVVARLTPK